MSMSRLVSLVISGIYVIVIWFGGESFKDVKGIMAQALIVGMLCIWFGDELGDMLGYLGHAQITSTTPGGCIRFIGWVILLLLPVIAFALQRILDNSGGAKTLIEH